MPPAAIAPGNADQGGGHFRGVKVVADGDPQDALLQGEDGPSLAGHPVAKERHGPLLGERAEQPAIGQGDGGDVFKSRVTEGAFDGSKDDRTAHLPRQRGGTLRVREGGAW